MRTVDQVYLKASWKNYYDGFKKHLTDEYERDERCKIYNHILKEELVRAQKAGRKLNYDEVCALCDEINRRVYSLNVSDHSDFDIKAVVSAIHGVTVTGAVAFVDPSGKSYDFAHMHYFGHIPVEGLTPNEVSFLLDCFGGSIDESWGVLIFTVLRTKINNYEYVMKKEDKILRMCRNAIYQCLNERVLEKTGSDLGLSSTWQDKLRDYFVRRLM